MYLAPVKPRRTVAGQEACFCGWRFMGFTAYPLAAEPEPVSGCGRRSLMPTFCEGDPKVIQLCLPQGLKSSCGGGVFQHCSLQWGVLLIVSSFTSPLFFLPLSLITSYLPPKTKKKHMEAPKGGRWYFYSLIWSHPFRFQVSCCAHNGGNGPALSRNRAVSILGWGCLRLLLTDGLPGMGRSDLQAALFTADCIS